MKALKTKNIITEAEMSNIRKEALHDKKKSDVVLWSNNLCSGVSFEFRPPKYIGLDKAFTFIQGEKIGKKNSEEYEITEAETYLPEDYFDVLQGANPKLWSLKKQFNEINDEFNKTNEKLTVLGMKRKNLKEIITHIECVDGKKRAIVELECRLENELNSLKSV